MYRKVVAKIGPGRVLDVGCGQGYLFLEMPPSRSDLYRLDLGKFDLLRAKKWA
jgi:2-polyprenyl-3-methyl-5-hydroxy-6-metoxy-1,4-benzoquinol methylase